MSVEEKITEETRKTENIARRGLKGNETLLSYCSTINRGWAGIFYIVGGIFLVLVGIVFSVAEHGNMPPIVTFIVFCGLGLYMLHYGNFYLKGSKYKYCFVTDDRICLLDKHEKIVKEISKENIQKVKFIPKRTMTVRGKNRGRTNVQVNSFLRFWAKEPRRVKKYELLPRFNDEEMARAIDQISKPYQKIGKEGNAA